MSFKVVLLVVKMAVRKFEAVGYALQYKTGIVAICLAGLPLRVDCIGGNVYDWTSV